MVGDCVAGEGNEDDSMDEVAACVHVDEEVDTCTVAGSLLEGGVGLGREEAEDTGTPLHWVSEGIPDALEDGVGTQRAVVDGAMKSLGCRAHLATAREVMVADSAACPSVASSELVALPLESICLFHVAETSVGWLSTSGFSHHCLIAPVVALICSPIDCHGARALQSKLLPRHPSIRLSLAQDPNG